MKLLLLALISVMNIYVNGSSHIFEITVCMYISDTAQLESNCIQFWTHIQWKFKGGTKHIRHKTLCKGVLPTLHSVRQTFTK